jgi:hypothetical protein
MRLFNVEEICARTRALGLGGKVTISHGFCLGDITEKKAALRRKRWPKPALRWSLMAAGAAG